MVSALQQIDPVSQSPSSDSALLMVLLGADILMANVKSRKWTIVLTPFTILMTIGCVIFAGLFGAYMLRPSESPVREGEPFGGVGKLPGTHLFYLWEMLWTLTWLLPSNGL